jgi:hypothetical protein
LIAAGGATVIDPLSESSEPLSDYSFDLAINTVDEVIVHVSTEFDANDRGGLDSSAVRLARGHVPAPSSPFIFKYRLLAESGRSSQHSMLPARKFPK